MSIKPNTVKTLQQVGFNFNVIDFSHQNPKYLISFKDSEKCITGFSKIYDDKENGSPFIAITACDNADVNCPFISEASARFHLPFVDPKFSDGTAQEREAYLVTNKQIASQVFIIFKEVKRLLS